MVRATGFSVSSHRNGCRPFTRPSTRRSSRQRGRQCLWPPWNPLLAGSPSWRPGRAACPRLSSPGGTGSSCLPTRSSSHARLIERSKTDGRWRPPAVKASNASAGIRSDLPCSDSTRRLLRDVDRILAVRGPRRLGGTGECALFCHGPSVGPRCIEFRLCNPSPSCPGGTRSAPSCCDGSTTRPNGSLQGRLRIERRGRHLGRRPACRGTLAWRDSATLASQRHASGCAGGVSDPYVLVGTL